MVVGTVNERRFLHWSSWDNPPASARHNTRAAWTMSHYWRHKIETHPVVPDEPVTLGNIHVERGHPLAQFLNQVTSVGKSHSELLKEYIFEDVRETEFVDLPSRRRCMFLLDAEHDARAYAKQINFQPTTLYEATVIEGNLHRAKLSLLNCNSMSAPELREQARRYWAPVEPSMDTEVLFEGIVELKRVA